MNLVYLTLTQVTILSGVPHFDPGDYEQVYLTLTQVTILSGVPHLDPGEYTIWCASP